MIRDCAVIAYEGLSTERVGETYLGGQEVPMVSFGSYRIEPDWNPYSNLARARQAEGAGHVRVAADLYAREYKQRLKVRGHPDDHLMLYLASIIAEPQFREDLISLAEDALALSVEVEQASTRGAGGEVAVRYGEAALDIEGSLWVMAEEVVRTAARGGTHTVVQRKIQRYRERLRLLKPEVERAREILDDLDDEVTYAAAWIEEARENLKALADGMKEAADDEA